MNSKKIVEGTVGTIPKKPTMLKDSDGDGVANVFDCEPYNSKKQGVIDTIKEKAKGVIESAKERSQELKREREERRLIESEIRQKEKEAAIEERKNQRVKTAVLREQVAGERTRESIKQKPKSNAFFVLDKLAGKPEKKEEVVIKPIKRKVTKFVKIKSGKNKGKFRKITKTITVKQRATTKATTPKGATLDPPNVVDVLSQRLGVKSKENGKKNKENIFEMRI